MPLDKQVAGVAFVRGLDTHTDKRVTIPGTLVELQNATLAEEGTLTRRNGYGAIASGTAINTLMTLGDQLVALDGSSLKTYSPAAGAMYSVGSTDNVTLSKDEIERGTGGQDEYDCATSGGLTCYVWRSFNAAGTATGVMVTVHDESTNSVVMPATTMNASATAFAARVVVVTGAFIIFYKVNSGTNLYARVIALTAPDTLGAETTMRTDAQSHLDACASGATAFVLYASNDATASVRAIAVTRSGTTPSVSAGPLNVNTQAQFLMTTVAGLTLAMFDATLIGVYVVAQVGAITPGLWAGVITTGMAVSVASAVVDATAAALNAATTSAVLNGTTMWVYSDDRGRRGEATATARLIRRIGLNSANAVVSAAATWMFSMTRPNGTNGPFLAGKAFLNGSTVYVPTAIQEAGTGALQNAFFLFNDSARVVARALYGTYGSPSTNTSNYPKAAGIASGSWILPIGERTLLSFAGGINVSATGMARLVFDLTAPALVDGVIGPVAYLANAAGAVFDGDQATEAAFSLFPEVVTVTVGGAGNVDPGDHQVVALYEWIDGAGQRHQSAPSPAVLFTSAGSTVTVTVPTLTLSQKAANVTIVVYATEDGPGSVFYRVNPLSSPVANSTTAPTVNVTYNIADTTLITQELLYTTGGILPNNAPPPASALAIHQNRVFINVSDDPFAFQYSQPWVSGFGVQWNETLRGRVESTGGAVSGFASMDDKLIIFRPRKIGVLYGIGPSTTGAQNGYNLQDLPVDVGCSEPRSILVMPEGVIFKSTSKGWYVLGRDLQLRWIGEGVEEWDSQAVTSAVLLDTQHECRFTTNDASGLTLVYFYPTKPGEVGMWGTYADFLGKDAVWWSGGNAYVRASATSILKELPPNSDGFSFGDGATSTTGTTPTTSPTPFTGLPIPITFRTGWLKPGDALQAFQRIWRVLLSGAASGYPAPATSLTADVLAGATVIPVVSTAAFGSVSGVTGFTLGLGTAVYETGTATITSATVLTAAAPLAFAHSAGFVIRGVPALGASGTMEVSFYFNGDDSTPYQTITVSDVSTLVTGNAWDVRLQPNLQKCDSIMIKVVQTPQDRDPGASLDFSGLTMELGVKKGAFRPPSTKTYG